VIKCGGIFAAALGSFVIDCCSIAAADRVALSAASRLSAASSLLLVALCCRRFPDRTQQHRCC
jgi:hypothetical protein